MFPYRDEVSSAVCLLSRLYLRSRRSEEVNAISFASGDHRRESLRASKSVILRNSPVPSEAATYISSRPLLSEVKAIHLPSGEYCGSRSRAGEGVICRRAPSSIGGRQS